VKALSITPVLAAVAAASLAGMALVAPVQGAQAGKGSSPKATTGSKFSTGMPNKTAGRLYCVGPSCPPRPSENRAPTTGTNKAQPGRGAPGGVTVTTTPGSKKRDPSNRPGRLCAGWGCPEPRTGPLVRDHRYPKGTPPGPPSPGKTQPK
jgi:hypothetical protein